jgi:hypothetical protein
MIALKQLTFSLAFVVASVAAAHAQFFGAPQPITTPVPEQWRAPFEQFLREMRVGDQNAKAMVGKTVAFKMGGVWRPDSILFRIEDPSVCSEDMCFTVIGRIVDNMFLADAMLSAGKRFTGGDNFSPLFGFQVLPLWLVGDKVTITLLETPKGWIIAPSRCGCTP